MERQVRIAGAVKAAFAATDSLWKLPWASVLWLFPLLFPVEIRGAEDGVRVTLTNSAGIRLLSSEEASRPYPVKLAGVVTYSDPGWGLLFVRDSIAGVFVSLNAPPYPTNGEQVEVTGQTASGSFLSIVSGASWRHLGVGTMPVPRSIDDPELFASQIDCEWTTVNGGVRRVALTESGDHFQLDVIHRGWTVRVFVPFSTKAEATTLSGLVDARIKVAGVGGVDIDSLRGARSLKMFVPSVSLIQVLEPPTADSFQLPLQPLALLRSVSTTNAPIHRVHLRGVVTFLQSPLELTIQDSGGALRIQTTAAVQQKLGDVVEAVGFVVPKLFSPVLEDAVLRPATGKMRAEPVEVKSASVLWGDYDARLISLSGALQNRVFDGTDHLLTLLQDGVLFGVTLQSTNLPKTWERLEKGDRVQVTGVCVLQGENRLAPQGFQVRLRSEEDVVYLSRLRVFSMRQVLAILAVVAVAWAVILAWSIALRRRVREQTAILRESEQRLRFTLENTGLGQWELDLQTGVAERSDQYARILGYEDASMPWTHSQFLEQHVHPEDRPGVKALVQRALQSGKGWELECRILRKDQTIRWVWEKSAVSTAADGRSRKVHGILMDITGRKALEDQLRQSQKMEGIGHLAGGIAHEFNNILASIMMEVGLLQTSNSRVAELEGLRAVESSCQRAAELVRQLLAFSRQSLMRLRPTDLAALVAQQCKMLGRLLGERITLDFRNEGQSAWVNADEALMGQVVVNLCLNARDAMKDGGSLRLAVVETEIGPEHVKAHLEARQGRHYCLSVSDSGGGMSESTLKRLFEPFFTTKGIGQGTGLGLATVRGIVQQHKGWVEVESTLGKGTTFRVYLPALAAGAPTMPVLPRRARTSPGIGTILLAEDEPSLRSATQQLLVQKGYHVLEAANGAEALALWAAHRSDIDLIYTDMVMPGDLSGLQVAQRALAEKPDVKVIITSGYNTDLVGLDEAVAVSIAYLPKPCAPAALMATIEKCLHRDAQPEG